MHIVRICFTIAILSQVCCAADKECNQTRPLPGGYDENSGVFDVFKSLPFYFSGFDFENIPVMVVEVGHWDIFGVSQNQDKLKAELERWHEEFYGCLEKISNSTVINIDGDETKIDEYVLIMDFDSFNLKMMSTSASSKLMLNLWKRFKEYDNSVSYGFYINLNPIAEYFLSLTKTLTSKALGRSEMFGNKKQTYIPAIYRKIPKRYLAPWYGGESECFDMSIKCF